jgi:hypothetical protein
MTFVSKVFPEGGIGTIIESKTLRSWVLNYAKDRNIKLVNENDANEGDAVVWYGNGLITQSSNYYEKSLTLISNDEFLTKLDEFAEEIEPTVWIIRGATEKYREPIEIDLDFYNEKIVFGQPLPEISFFVFKELARHMEMGNRGYDKAHDLFGAFQD